MAGAWRPADGRSLATGGMAGALATGGWPELGDRRDGRSIGDRRNGRSLATGGLAGAWRPAEWPELGDRRVGRSLATGGMAGALATGGWPEHWRPAGWPEHWRPAGWPDLKGSARNSAVGYDCASRLLPRSCPQVPGENTNKHSLTITPPVSFPAAKSRSPNCAVSWPCAGKCPTGARKWARIIRSAACRPSWSWHLSPASCVPTRPGRLRRQTHPGATASGGQLPQARRQPGLSEGNDLPVGAG